MADAVDGVEPKSVEEEEPKEETLAEEAEEGGKEEKVMEKEEEGKEEKVMEKEEAPVPPLKLGDGAKDAPDNEASPAPEEEAEWRELTTASLRVAPGMSPSDPKRVSALQKDVDQREALLTKSKHQGRALRMELQEKDKEIQALAEELFQVREEATNLHNDVRVKGAELAAIREHTKAMVGTSAEDADERSTVEQMRVQVQHAEARARMKRTPASEFFHHLTRLEGEIEARKKVLVTLKKERRRLETLLRDRDGLVSQLTKDAQKRKDVEGQVSKEENRARALALRIEELERENGVLRHVQKLKTESVDRLTRELEEREATEESMALLQDEMRKRDGKINGLEAEQVKLRRELSLIYEEDTKLKDAATPVTMDDWKDERQHLKKEAIVLQVKRSLMEKEAKVVDGRIARLEHRLKVVNQSLKALGRIPLRLEDHLSEKLGEESVEGLYEIEEGRVMISAAQFDVLAKDVRSARKALREKDMQVQEADEQVEELGRKAEIVPKALRSERMRGQVTAQDLNTEVQRLRAEQTQREREYAEEYRVCRNATIRAMKRLERERAQARAAAEVGQ